MLAIWHQPINQSFLEAEVAGILCLVQYAPFPFRTREWIHETESVCETQDNKPHCNPHRQPTSSPLAEEEGKDTTSKTAQVVYTDNDTLQPSVGVAELIAKVLIADDTAEYSLIVSGYEQADQHPD
jgi:hypothetical protein